jgi:hypothetical protein
LFPHIFESFVQALDLEGNVMQSRTPSLDEPFHGAGAVWRQRLDGRFSHWENAFKESITGCLMIAA